MPVEASVAASVDAPDPEDPDSPLHVEILHDCDAWANAVPDVDQRVRHAVTTALTHVVQALTPAPEQVAGTLCFLLTNDAHICDLNHRFRGKDAPTNVLSFPGFSEDVDYTALLGDVAMAYETTAREAHDEGKTLTDHLTHLVVHGVLHLLGFTHDADDHAETMENLERTILDDLGIADPYAYTDANNDAHNDESYDA